MLWRHLATFVSPSSSFVCLVISFGFAFDEHWWTLMNTVRLWVPEIDRWKWRERSWVGIYYQRCEMCEQNDAEKLHNRYFVEAVILPGGLLKSLEDNLIDRGLQTSERDLQYLFYSFLFFSCFWTKYCVKCKQDRGSVLARKETPSSKSTEVLLVTVMSPWCHQCFNISGPVFLSEKNGPVAL